MFLIRKFIPIMSALAVGTLVGAGQQNAPAEKSPFYVNITFAKQHWLPTEKPMAMAHITNTTDKMISLGCFYDIYVERVGLGEAPKTEWWASPNSKIITLCAPVEVYPLKEQVQTFDLAAFYKLTAPGEYTIWVSFGGTKSDIARFFIDQKIP